MPLNHNPGTCRGCQRPILWVKTPVGKMHPLDPAPEKRWVFIDDDNFPELQGWSLMDTYKSHFATCPEADNFRKKRKPSS